VIVLSSAVLGFCLFLASESTRVSVEDTREKVRRDLPIGTERSEILSWLAVNEIELGSEGRASEYFQTRNINVDPGARVIVGDIFNAGKELFGENHIEIYFVLDSQDRLADTIVVQTRTGL
jgi:hypothetical protein